MSSAAGPGPSARLASSWQSEPCGQPYLAIISACPASAPNSAFSRSRGASCAASTAVSTALASARWVSTTAWMRSFLVLK